MIECFLVNLTINILNYPARLGQFLQVLKQVTLLEGIFVLNFTWPMRLLIQIHSLHSSSLPDYFPRSLARSHLVDYYFLSLLSSYI